jgi:hypothetical protein
MYEYPILYISVQHVQITEAHLSTLYNKYAELPDLYELSRIQDSEHDLLIFAM